MPALPERVVAHVLRGPTFAGYRIALLGDLHLAPWRSTRALAAAVDAVNAWRPDLIALIGDYGYSVHPVPALSRALYRSAMPRVSTEFARLQARDGAYAVLGNHDMEGGADVVTKSLESAGIQVLRDTSHDVIRNYAVLRVLGVDDQTPTLARLHAVSSRTSTSLELLLLLSHHPDFALACDSLSRELPLLIIAGHTHGGQIVLPWIGAPITLSRAATHRFPAGFVPNEHGTLYVNRGLGEQVPLRVGAAREITFLELALR